jgi:hypothetical protein
MELIGFETTDRAHVTLIIIAKVEHNWFDKKFRGMEDYEVRYIGSGVDWEHEHSGVKADNKTSAWLSVRWNKWQLERQNRISEAT